MSELITVFHGTRALRAAMDISRRSSDLFHAYRMGNPTPNLSTLFEDAMAYAVDGAILEFAVPLNLLLVAGTADPNNPVQWYTPIARVSEEDYKNLPHDFRQYLAKPLRLINISDTAAPMRWPKDLVITVLSAVYFKKIHFTR